MTIVSPRRPAYLGLLLVASLLPAGCDRRAETTASGDVQQAKSVSTEPGEIELSNPTVTLSAPNRIRFAVNYRFTKGKPDKFYLCEIAFPGTQNHGSKPMDSWEFKSEGVIEDRIDLAVPPVETFEIRVSEADSPQNGYKLISNVVRGPVK